MTETLPGAWQNGARVAVRNALNARAKDEA